jgi:hypothetical protein
LTIFAVISGIAADHAATILATRNLARLLTSRNALAGEGTGEKNRSNHQAV